MEKKIWKNWFEKGNLKSSTKVKFNENSKKFLAINYVFLKNFHTCLCMCVNSMFFFVTAAKVCFVCYSEVWLSMVLSVLPTWIAYNLLLLLFELKLLYYAYRPGNNIYFKNFTWQMKFPEKWKHLYFLHCSQLLPYQ